MRCASIAQSPFTEYAVRPWALKPPAIAGPVEMPMPISTGDSATPSMRRSWMMISLVRAMASIMPVAASQA